MDWTYRCRTLWKSAAEIALNSQLEQYFERPDLDLESIQGCCGRRQQAKSHWIRPLSNIRSASDWRKMLPSLLRILPMSPAAERMIKLLDLIPSLPFPVILWEAQNVCYRPLVTAFQQNGWHSPSADPVALRRHDDLNRLASQLHILLPEASLKMPPKRLPSATYRVQLNQNFRFADTWKILDYLQELGISDLYLSPVLASRKGSGHGYDVTDPTRINPELGSEEDFATLQAELQNRGMGLLLDTVPKSHGGQRRESLVDGCAGKRRPVGPMPHFFDIEWHPHSRSLDGRILLPSWAVPSARPWTQVKSNSHFKTAGSSFSISILCFRSLHVPTTRFWITASIG